MFIPGVEPFGHQHVGHRARTENSRCRKKDERTDAKEQIRKALPYFGKRRLPERIKATILPKKTEHTIR